jgi:hypothetical protein
MRHLAKYPKADSKSAGLRTVGFSPSWHQQNQIVSSNLRPSEESDFGYFWLDSKSLA